MDVRSPVTAVMAMIVSVSAIAIIIKKGIKMYQQFSSHITNNGTSKISGDVNLQPVNCYLTAVTSVAVGSSTITFSDDANLGVLEIPGSGTISFPSPIRCSTFTPSHADLSIAYYVSSI